MITASEYSSILNLLQNVNQPAYAILPSAENIYNIDVNTRVVETPKSLSIEKDHNSRTIYFSIDRYIDYMDLAQTCCVIHYKNANGKSRYYPVPFYDIYSKVGLGKMLFPWNLDGHVTEKAGPIQFSIRFFKIGERHTENNDVEPIFTYMLSTLPAYSVITESMKDIRLESDPYYLKPGEYEQLNWRIDTLFKSTELSWTVLDDSVNYASITEDAEEDIEKIEIVVETNQPQEE